MKFLFELETLGDPDDGMVSVLTGCTDGNNKKQIAVINMKNVTGVAGDKKQATCHDCGAKEGEIHQRGCDMERCPFCGGQLITCSCSYIKLGFDYKDFTKEIYQPGNFQEQFKEFEKLYPYAGLPKEIYENGLPKDLQEKWEKILKEKGRVPYIQYPNLCRKCGMLWPEMFNVSDEEWKKYVRIGEREEMLCRPCYDQIKQWIDEGTKKSENEPTNNVCSCTDTEIK